MPFDIDDDEYVAKILAQDAKKTTQTYGLVGLDAFNPKRSRAGAPKPNTNFLRQIIRQTDSHNAALLAKEAEESSSRLRRMNREMDKERTEAVDRAKRRIEGRLSPTPTHNNSQRQRSGRGTNDEEDRCDGRSDRRRRHRDIRSNSRSRRHRDRSEDRHRDKSKDRRRDRSRERHRLKRQHEESDDDRTPHNPKRLRDHQRDHHRKRRNSKEDGTEAPDRIRRRQAPRLRSPSRSRSQSPSRKSHQTRDRSRSPRYSSRRSSSTPRTSRKSERRSNSLASESDPLEAIIGPLPPPTEPLVRSRGRGALRADNVGIETRFSTDYDPSMDMEPNPDAEDEWGGALETMRDRERWKQQGAGRLRAAGFNDTQVEKWEKGGDPVEEDVVWTKKGQGREWDRGKVVDEDGDVGLRAEWGRLK